MTRHGGFRTFGRVWVCALVAIAATCTAVLTGVVEPAGAASAPVVHTRNGTVRGTTALNGDRHFFDIPYAAAPTGSHRFQPPRPAAAWSGVRDASQHGPACPQNAVLAVEPKPKTSEDCLNLDVYTPPAAKSRHLPVMVFIYGGAYEIGSADGYDPSALVDSGDVISVVMNYRVGPLGFLALPELAGSKAADGTTGNAGLLDQRAALAWVRDNIASFGGDAHNVTIFGESAGGNSVCAQLASPGSKGLFQKAIVESGTCTSSPLQSATLHDAEDAGAAYARQVGCTTVRTRLACLDALPADKLIDVPSDTFHSLDVVWRPTIDGVTETASFTQRLRDGAARSIPLLQGTNHDEGRFLVAVVDDLQGHPDSTADYEAWVRHTYGSRADAVLARYPASRFLDGSLAKAQVVTDGFFACPGAQTTAAAEAGGEKTWQYEFDATVPVITDIDPVMPLGMGAFHGAELFYLMSTVQGLPSPVSSTPLATQMQREWTTFARTGNPNAAGLPTWNQASASTNRFLAEKVVGSSMSSGFAAEHQCAFWSTINR